VYLSVGLAVAIVVAVGFGPTVNDGLFNPPSPRPWMLYLHAAMFTAWVVLFIAQAALVRDHRVAWHRRLGAAGFILGALMPVVGIWTALVMTRYHRAGSRTGGEAPLVLSFFDMLAFAVTFGLAAYWRRRLEYHRRLMLIATCGLTVAAYARFPSWLMPAYCWYGGVDVLILAGAAWDWFVMRRVHAVYIYSVPVLVLGQTATMWIYLKSPSAWVSIARALLR
jgi:FtsH-binding integral membrane protein